MKIVLITLSLLALSSTSFARAPYKKALGVADCTFCHVKGDFKKANLENPMYKKSKEYADKIAKGEGEFKGKNCNDCHNGQQKPAAK